jgi:PilZ domain
MSIRIVTPGEPELAHHARRAQRFEIPGKILYRTRDEVEWREGRIQNLSKTGVFFVADPMQEMGGRIQMRLMLAPTDSGGFRVEIAVTGRIVRQARPEVGTAECGIAASIASYRILPRRA